MNNATVVYQCPNCGAGLMFDPEKQKFCCDFCISEFTEAELIEDGAEDRARAEEEADKDFCEQMNEYLCPNCGAAVVADESTAADFCYFCHNPIVLSGKLSGQMKPHKIIPFKYNKEMAENEFINFAKKKWFVPRRFFAKDQADKISGIYFPFWVTDADTRGLYNATATKIRVWRVGNVQYTETSKYKIQRSGDIHFEDIVTSALSEADKTMLEAILPFPSDSLIDFSMPYLSGFVAKKRDIDRESLSGEIKHRMKNYANEIFRGTVQNGYNSVVTNSCNVDILSSHWEYTLMPIWVLTYKGKKNKVYTYAMNGYTGKIYGEIPIDWKRLFAFFGGIACGAAALLSMLGGVLFC